MDNDVTVWLNLQYESNRLALRKGSRALVKYSMVILNKNSII